MSSRDRREASNVEVVIWALALLHAGEEPVHLEDVAASAFRLKPGAFRWDLEAYAKNIDKDKVRVSLTDAAKPKYGALARGVGDDVAQVSKPTDWWRLTAAGIRWVGENTERLSDVFDQPPPGLKREAVRRVRQRIETSDLFREYLVSGSVPATVYGLADLIECSPDARGSVFQDRFDSLQAQVMQLGDSKLERFLAEVKKANRSILGEVAEHE